MLATLYIMNDIIDLISQISYEISHNPDINLVLDSIIKNIYHVIKATRVTIMFPDKEHNFLYIKAARGNFDNSIYNVRVKFGEGIAGYVAQSRSPLFFRTKEDFKKFGISHNPLKYQNYSAISIPIIYKDKLLGVLNLNDKINNESFTELDYKASLIIANQSAVAIYNSILFKHYLEKEKLRQSILIAREIQQYFLPQYFEQVPGFEIDGWGQTCDETGGDYYDYFQFFDEKLAIVIGDVAGHGIGAALIMASARAALRAYTENLKEVEEIFFKLNNLLESNLEYSNFMTLLFLMIDANNNTLQYISAGHEGPLMFRSNSDEVIEYPSTGVALGIIKDSKFKVSDLIKLEKGDLFILFTDGLVEVHNKNKEMLGKQRLINFIKKHKHKSVKELKKLIIQFWFDFKEDMPQEDDISLILIKKL